MEKTIGDKVNEILEIRKMSRAELSRLSGLSTGLYISMESGKNTFTSLEIAALRSGNIG